MIRLYLTICLITIVYPFTSTKGQTLTGLVIDSDSIAIPFATVTVMNGIDSTFIAGCVTDTFGIFKIENPKIENIKKPYLSVRSIGYRPVNISLNPSSAFHTIILTADNILLDQVTITGYKPIVKANAGSFQYSLTNTPISKLGTLSDVIKNLPLVQSNDDSYNIIGIGSPIFYINNRKIQDLSELKRINSEEVKDIEIIYNPGSEYNSDVKCVIKITTISRLDNSWGLGILSKLSYNPKVNNEHTINLNYQHQKFYLFSVGSFTDKRMASKMNTDMSFINEGILYEPITKDIKNIDYRNALLKVGANYQHSTKLSFGAQYEYKDHSRNPLSRRESHASSTINNHETSYNYSSIYDGDSKSHYINTNLDWKINNTNKVYINFDFYKKKSNIRNSSIGESGESVFLESTNRTNSQLASSNIWYNSSLPLGIIKIGIETSNTRFKQYYDWKIEEDRHSKSSSNQIYIAPYISYNKNIKHLDVNFGLRYEYVDYQYKLNDIKERNLSRTYNNLSPSFSIQYTHNNNLLGLSYRTHITRPSYQMLNSTITFVNPYAYQSGNPELKMTIGNTIDFIYSYANWFLAKINYSFLRNNTVYVFEKDKNELRYYFKPFNINTNQYAATLTFYKRLGIWLPNLSAGIYGQVLSVGDMHYNKPYLMLDIKNVFSLKEDWLISTNILYRTNGNIGTSLVYNNYVANISVTKQFNRIWSLTMGVNNAFGSLKDDAKLYDSHIVFRRDDKPQEFIPYITLKVNLNKLRKNTSDNRIHNSEINRLQ